MANLVEWEGEQIQAQIEKKAKRILEDYGFASDGSLTDRQKARSAMYCSDVTCDHVDRAMKVFSDLKDEALKNATERDNLIKYLHRNQDCIAC